MDSPVDISEYEVYYGGNVEQPAVNINRPLKAGIYIQVY
jgi:hypothetical protein